MLNTIYASIEAASTAAGWDGVDLLIIGGDFQVCDNVVVESHAKTSNGESILIYLGIQKYCRPSMYGCSTKVP